MPEIAAITICQPYAELIARGEKRIENRTWPTAYRGPLLIHAGRSTAWLDTWPEQIDGMPFGAAVAVGRLVACVRLEDLQLGRVAPEHRHLATHPHANGPWCWILADVERLATPAPMTGKQGLWRATWPPVAPASDLLAIEGMAHG